jgi:SAM-dependent methyltransferase
MQEIRYAGKELQFFQHASVWKKYFADFIKPYLHGKVLEVGAGIGGTTTFLSDGKQQRWICLEPDRHLFEILQSRIINQELPSACIAVNGTIDHLNTIEKFDAILYIDVLEHIDDDATELAKAAALLADEGHLIILSPAHESVYSAFDKSIGHYRRYSKQSLNSVAPSSLVQKKLKYLDSIGLLASLMNKYMLHQSLPSVKQIKIWDRCMIPISKVSDFITGYSIGRSILGVWQNKLHEKSDIFTSFKA